MSRSIAKIVMRVLGTLAGILGVVMLLFVFTPFVLGHRLNNVDSWMVLLMVFPLALAVYFIYVAYLVWFRLSPLAVRHLCGALGFFVLTRVVKFFDPERASEEMWMPFAFLGCLLLVYFAYRTASSRLSKWLFPETATGH